MHAYATRHLRRLGLLFAWLLLSAHMSVALDIGDQAPDFTLPSTTGTPVSLHQFQGHKHVLIQFYSQDFNPT